MSYELIFAYPSEVWDDFSVHKKKVDEIDLFYASMEGYILYDTLQDGVDYFKKIKDAYYNFVKNTFYKPDCDETEVKYKTYDIEVTEGWGGEGVMIYLSAPNFIDEYTIYEWLDGVIKQLEKVEL